MIIKPIFQNNFNVVKTINKANFIVKKPSFDVGFFGNCVNKIDLNNFEFENIQEEEFEQKIKQHRLDNYIENAFFSKEYDLLQKYKNLTLGSNLFEDYNNKQYDLVQKFAIACVNTAQKQGGAFIINKVPKIFEGIREKELMQKLNCLSAMLNKDAINEFTINNKKYRATLIPKGRSEVYKITDERKNSAIFKISTIPNQVGVHGSFGETVIHQQMQKDKVYDIPTLYMANPLGKRVIITQDNQKIEKTYGAWQLSEFVTEQTPLKKGKMSQNQWLEKNNLYSADETLSGIIGKYYVDMGGILRLDNSFSLDKSMFSWLVSGYNQGKEIEDMIKEFEKIIDFED